MSTTEEQAAATSQPNDDDKQRLLALQQQMSEVGKEAGAPNPAGSPTDNENPSTTQARAYYERQRQAAQQKLNELKQQYDSMVSTKPELKTFAESHKATPYEIQTIEERDFAANLNTKARRGDLDYQRRDIYRQVVQENPNASINEIVKKYNERVSTFNQNIGNVSTDYEATLAARQAGYNVGSGISNNLPETFQKDFEKRFAEHNKQINLTEGNVLVSKPAPSPQPPEIKPQNPRVQAERDQPNKLYAKPGFAQKGSDQYKGIKPQVNVLDSSLPSSAEFSSGPFDLGVQNNTATIFGIEPKKPRQLTDAEFAALSPGEQDAYLKQIQYWNEFAAYATEKSNQVNKALKIVNQAEWEKYKGDLLSYLAAEKKAGVKQVTILSKNDLKTVPIDQAFFGIITTKDVRGILTPPTIPEGYSVAGVNLTGEGFTEYGSNPVGTLLLSKNEPPKPAEPKTGEEWWSSFVAKVGQRANQITSDRSQNPVARSLAAAGQVGAEIAGGFITLGGEISRFKLPDIRKAAGELFNGTMANETQTNQTEPINPPGTITDRNLNVTSVSAPVPESTPATPPGALISGVSAAVMAAAVTRNPSLLVSGASEAFKQYSTIAARQGLLPTVVQTAVYVDPLALIKISPLRGASLIIPVGRGIGKGVTSEIAAETIARQLKIGRGEGLGRVGVGYANGKFFVGIPKPNAVALEKLTYTPERGGYRITEGPNATYMTSPQVLERLVKLQKLNPEEAQLITVQREAATLTGKIKDVPLRKDLTGIESGQPQASLLPGKETKTFEDLIVSGQKRSKEPIPAVKGSIINQYFDLSPRQRRDLDVDLGMSGKSLEHQIMFGEKEAKRIAEGMNALESPEKETKLHDMFVPTHKSTKTILQKIKEEAENIQAKENAFRATILGRTKPIASEVKFGKDVGMSEFAGAVSPAYPGTIFLGRESRKLTPQETINILSHETVHDVLNKLKEYKASSAFDVIEYGSAKGDIVKKLAPSLYNEGRLGTETAINILLRQSNKKEIFEEIKNTSNKQSREFKAKGGAVKVLSGNEKQKVIEFVTEKESLNYNKNYKSNPDLVFNLKVPHNVITPGGRGKMKMLSYRFQGLRKTSSILELGGDMPKRVGDSLGVSKRREKDIRDNVEYLLTKASQAKNEKTAIKLKEAAIITERFARKRGWWTEEGSAEMELSDVEAPNILRSAGHTIIKISNKPSIAGKAALVQETEPSPSQSRKAAYPIGVRSASTKLERSVGMKSRSASMGSVGTKSTGMIPSPAQRSPGTKSPGNKKSVGPLGPSAGSPAMLTSPGIPRPSPGGTKPSPANPLSPGSRSPGGFAPEPKRITPKPVPITENPLLEPKTGGPPSEFFSLKQSQKEKKRGKSARTKPDFLGNVPEEQIGGMFKRYEVIVGTRASARQLRKDIAYTRKKAGFVKFSSQKKTNILSNRKQNILSRPPKKAAKASRKKSGGLF